MSRIKNLYTYLVGHQRPQADGWLVEYLGFSDQVALMREVLLAGPIPTKFF